MWLVTFAARRHRRDRIRQLQWRGEHEALTDRCDDRFAGKPDLVRAITECTLFPLPRRHQPAMLAHHVDSRVLAESELIQVGMHLVDAERCADLVKIDVAGLRNGVMQVHCAMSFRFPVAVSVSALRQGIKTPAEVAARQIRRTGLQRRHRQHWLDCRTRRVCATNGPVE